MQGTSYQSADGVRKAAAAIRSRRPSFASKLDFYAEVFSAQERSKSSVRIDRAGLLKRDLKDQRQKMMLPLIEPADFRIDAEASKQLFETLLRVAAASPSNLALSAQALNKALQRGSVQLDRLFWQYLEENEEYFLPVAADLHINRSCLFFFIYNSMKPSLSACAEILADYLPLSAGDIGQCPICGSPPFIALLEFKGKRFLVCSLCGHRWLAPRIYCPFCQNIHSDTLVSFAATVEEEYRIDACLKCKTYIKTVDTRCAERLIHPSLEHVSTPHLDIKAAKMGFVSCIER